MPDVSRPQVSVIVPGRNSGAALEACLAGLRAQDWPSESYELIYVDDSSTDESPERARAWVDRVVRLHDGPAGPAAARNAGAAAASGEVLIFIDADVVAAPGTVSGLLRPLVEEPALDAVFGSYDREPAHPGFVSQYRNLLHHHVHQTSRGEATTFWAGCGAIRRSSFLRVGGFDAGRYRRPSMEDIDLGRRMRAAGMRIRLAPEVQVKHLKRWTPLGVVRSDVLDRGIPWMRMLLEDRGRSAEVGDLNLRASGMASVPLSWGALLLLAASLRLPWLALPSLGMAASVVALNLPTYSFFYRARGLRFTLSALPLHFLHHLCNGASVAGALAAHILDRRAGRPRAAGGQP